MTTLTMMPIETAPLNREIVLYWKDLPSGHKDHGHFEGGTLYDDSHDGSIYHVLFDGNSMFTKPTHWAELPEIKFA